MVVGPRAASSVPAPLPEHHSHRPKNPRTPVCSSLSDRKTISQHPCWGKNKKFWRRESFPERLRWSAPTHDSGIRTSLRHSVCVVVKTDIVTDTQTFVCFWVNSTITHHSTISARASAAWSSVTWAASDCNQGEYNKSGTKAEPVSPAGLTFLICSLFCFSPLSLLSFFPTVW